MNDEKLEQVLQKVEPEKRSMLKKLVVAAGFAVPVIASFSVQELAQADIGSMGITTTITVTNTITSPQRSRTFMASPSFLDTVSGQYG